MPLYSGEFYRHIRSGSHRSAEEIVPLVMTLLQPRSVIDVGCGLGAWLRVFEQYGVEDVFGVDGSYVDTKTLEIPVERFAALDLAKPFRLDRQFDLVMSLEVAEHIPGACAEIFIESLTRLGPVVLFSAAIPFQGGTHHVNEQWPDYWVRYFAQKDYVPVDCFRRKIWQNEHVEWWYIQNMLLFVNRAYLENHHVLQREMEHTHLSQLALIHPRKYLDLVDSMNRIILTIHDLAKLLSPENTFILVDEEQLRWIIAPGCRAIPFLERDGHYWGVPSDDLTAIRELERLRQTGARCIVFTWPSFWWLEYYTTFHSYLRSQFCCVLHNDRLIVFDLWPSEETATLT